MVRLPPVQHFPQSISAQWARLRRLKEKCEEHGLLINTVAWL